jgi:hypothetical protein
VSRASLPKRVELRGLEVAPGQVWGSVRLVPLLRRNAPGDLRLAQRSYVEDAMVVSLDSGLLAAGKKYVSYVPHGLVLSWDDNGSPVAPFGTHMKNQAKPDGKRLDFSDVSVRVAHRINKREDKNRLRLLPLHLAMEGFLAHHFGAPDIAWCEYSRQGLSRGLDPRSESGQWIPGLDDALRVFEIHEDQVGVLVFVSGELASAFVVSHPEDYRALHLTLLEDFYTETLFYYGLCDEETEMTAPIDGDRVESLADLRTALSAMRQEWESFQVLMADGLLGREVNPQRIYRAGPFQLLRFMPDLSPMRENHIGESILREDGTVEYLKTYRLSEAQRKRAYLLSQLAGHNWNVEATAKALKQSQEDFVLRLENAGFGYLLHQHVLDGARARRRRQR